MTRFHHRRTNQTVRDACAETTIVPEDCIQVFFLVEGTNILKAIPALSGTAQVSTDRLAEACRPFLAHGIKTFLLFGNVDSSHKDSIASASSDENSIICQGIKALKSACPDARIMTDICLCAYTDHGHCGLLHQTEGNGLVIDNDATLALLASMACAHAKAGADWVAPSAMMDGQVSAIRKALDANGFSRSGSRPCHIMGYSAKFASAFYGPFRQAADSSPAIGDRKTYQMDYRNGNEAMDEIRADLEEQADAVMVKPAMGYLDVIARARNTWKDATIVAYHTSGEFMSLKAAASTGILDYTQALSEHLHAMRRAGTTWIISYGLLDYFSIPCPWETKTNT